MANDKNPLNQLRDLVELKDQLEDIQRRVEDEIQAGVPPAFLNSELRKPLGEEVKRLQPKIPSPDDCGSTYYYDPGGSFLASPFLKGFMAGYIIARLRSSALMGVAVGTCTGIYAAQNYKVPNIESTLKDYISSLRGGRK